MKLRWLVIVLLLVQLLAPTGKASADIVPFFSFGIDANERLISMSPAYLPVSLVGNDLPRLASGKHDALKYPEDVFVDAMDNIYIADRGNDRVIQFDENGTFMRFFGSDTGTGKLKGPEGVFVDSDGTVYVADTGNGRLVQYTKEGRFLKEFLVPKSDYLPKDFRYAPSKLVVDSRGMLFVVSKGSYQGMLQITPNNEFLGFYGKNKVSLNLVERLQRMFYTKEQRDKLPAVLPGSITNVTINKQGFLYTTTISVKKEQIKKLNYAGQNILSEKKFQVPRRQAAGENMRDYLFRDVAVNDQGMLTAIDSKTNNIIQYDAQGKLLFTFGSWSGSTIRLGSIKSPSGIAVTSKGDVIISDNQTNLVQVLHPTPFTQQVLSATGLYLEGKYEQSVAPWQQVLKLNEYFDRAHLGLAKAYYKKSEWPESMAEYRLALDSSGYSDAFWQVRMLWLQERFDFLMGAALVLVMLYALMKRFDLLGRWRGLHPIYRFLSRPVTRHVTMTGSVLKRPYSSFEELRDAGSGTWSFSIVLLAAAMVSRLAGEMLTGFVFHPLSSQLINPVRSELLLLIPLLSWVLCNYLVSTLYRGEGTFKLVFVGTMYSLLPYLVVTVPLALLSNVLTVGEGVIYSFVQKAAVIWTCALLFIKVQVIHNYDVKESVINVVLTAFTMMVLWFAVFVHLGLSLDLKDFVAGLKEELMARG